MSWLYSINHPTHRNRAACTTQCSTPSVIPVRYPSLPKEFTSLLWAQISAEKNFIYWKFLREKKSKSHQKLFSNLVTRIRVWARIELFYTNTNHSQYHSRSRSHAPIQCNTAPIQCNTAPIQCKRAKIPTFVLFHVEHRTNTVQNRSAQTLHRTNTVQNRSAQTLHRTNTVQHTVPCGTIPRAILGMI